MFHFSKLNPSGLGQSHRDEEIASDHGYHSHYHGNRHEPIEVIVADFEAQAIKLDSYFGCGQVFNYDWLIAAHASTPLWVEKFFAQVPWYKIATSYNRAVEIVLKTLAESRPGKFFNFLNIRDQEYLYHENMASDTRRRLDATQSGFDLVVLPAQFGLRHRGRSIWRANEMFSAGEFNLDTFSVVLMLLTHANRLEYQNNLWINCAGDTISSNSSEAPFDSSPSFKCDGTDVCLESIFRSTAMKNCGSATGFFPIIRMQ